MKTEIKVMPHHTLSNTNVIELWYDGKFIATVTGADGPGIRLLSKHLNNDDLAVKFDHKHNTVQVLEIILKNLL